jgi:hypothetical protein
MNTAETFLTKLTAWGATNHAPQALLAAALAAAAGCSGPGVETTVPVDLTGEIHAPQSASGAEIVHVALYQISNEDEPSDALSQIGSFDTKVGAFRQRFDYPETKGKGLVVWAWLDADGNGVLCTSTDGDEPAGLALVEPFPVAPAERYTRLPAGNMIEQRFPQTPSVQVYLTEPCAAAESLLRAARSAPHG